MQSVSAEMYVYYVLAWRWFTRTETCWKLCINDYICLIIVQKDATVFSLLYFCRQLYMFRVLAPIIRSSYNCNYSFWHWSTRSTNIRSRCWVEFQQQPNRYCCLLASGYSLASRQQYLFDRCLLLYVQSWTPDDGRKDRPKHVECHSKIK